jgi:hypothetical protein
MEYSGQRTQIKHKWTEDERMVVRQEYRGTLRSAAEIARRLGVTLYGVKGQAAKMGLCKDKSPRWTEEEIERLGELIHRYPVAVVAKKLHRSINAVVVKSTREKMQRGCRDGWYSKMDVCRILATDHHKVQKWIDAGILRARWREPDKKPGAPGMAMWYIEEADLARFIRIYPQELVGRNIDIIQIVAILTDPFVVPKREARCGVPAGD